MNSYCATHSRHWAHRAVIASSLLLLAACEQGQQPQPANESTTTQLDWARSALERNPRIELVATDASAQVFTVRDKQTGKVSALKLDELAAAPVSQLTGQATPPQNDTTPSGPEPAATTAQSTADEQTSAAASTDAQTQKPTATTNEASAQVQGEPGNYTIERSDGQVRVTGPGVSIVSSGSAEQTRTEETNENRVEPIICEGARMVHFDNRVIRVEGDAITVRGGCEMYITNSRIVASGTGIVVQDGVVHVSNSHIQGEEGSFDADNRAKLFVRSSTFTGIPRRSEMAMVQDQGGNRWR